MTWLARTQTRRQIDRMVAEFAAIDERLRRAPRLSHPCGCCGGDAERIDVAASGELACYHCFACRQNTIVDLSSLPRLQVIE